MKKNVVLFAAIAAAICIAINIVAVIIMLLFGAIAPYRGWETMGFKEALLWATSSMLVVGGLTPGKTQ